MKNRDYNFLLAMLLGVWILPTSIILATSIELLIVGCCGIFKDSRVVVISSLGIAYSLPLLLGIIDLWKFRKRGFYLILCSSIVLCSGATPSGRHFFGIQPLYSTTQSIVDFISIAFINIAVYFVLIHLLFFFLFFFVKWNGDTAYNIIFRKDI